MDDVHFLVDLSITKCFQSPAAPLVSCAAKKGVARRIRGIENPRRYTTFYRRKLLIPIVYNYSPH
jgi:hypothetical protein